MRGLGFEGRAIVWTAFIEYDAPPVLGTGKMQNKERDRRQEVLAAAGHHLRAHHLKGSISYPVQTGAMRLTEAEAKGRAHAYAERMTAALALADSLGGPVSVSVRRQFKGAGPVPKKPAHPVRR